MSVAPTGTVTFLFTDIEGSTKLWEKHPDAMRRALVRHDDLLRSCIEDREGYVFKTVGDAFCAAFPTANRALEAALAAQLDLAAELWETKTPLLVPQAVAQVLGAREELGRPIQQTLVEALRAKRLLLVLDNCEHLVAACASLVADLLRNCPDVHLLASSREPLNASGEQTYRVPSLTLPDPKQAQTVESLSQFEAVRLFIERAQAVQSSFVVTNQNAQAVAQVCFRLDGIPLAIELAAARVRSLSVEEVNTRLGHRFRLLLAGTLS